jgi:hypothetical protein
VNDRLLKDFVDVYFRFRDRTSEGNAIAFKTVRADSLLRIQKQAAILLRMAKDCPAVGVVAGPISQPPWRKRFEMRLARYSAISTSSGGDQSAGCARLLQIQPPHPRPCNHGQRNLDGLPITLE